MDLPRVFQPVSGHNEAERCAGRQKTNMQECIRETDIGENDFYLIVAERYCPEALSF